MKKIGTVDTKSIDILLSVFDECKDYIGQNLYDSSINKKETFWINLFQSGASDEDFKLPINSIDILHKWLQSIITTTFNSNLKIVRYQFIINPIGSCAQRWHIDYILDFSTVFIPLIDLNLLNSPQYLTVPDFQKTNILDQIQKTPDDINLDDLALKNDFLIVSQLVCKAWSILYM